MVVQVAMLCGNKTNIFFLLLATSTFFIHHLTVGDSQECIDPFGKLINKLPK